jgi:hypothetical protein
MKGKSEDAVREEIEKYHPIDLWKKSLGKTIIKVLHMGNIRTLNK